MWRTIRDMAIGGIIATIVLYINTVIQVNRYHLQMQYVLCKWKAENDAIMAEYDRKNRLAYERRTGKVFPR